VDMTPIVAAKQAHCRTDFPEKQVSSLHAQSIDHGIFTVKASELPNQVVVDAVHGDRGA